MLESADFNEVLGGLELELCDEHIKILRCFVDKVGWIRGLMADDVVKDSLGATQQHDTNTNASPTCR